MKTNEYFTMKRRENGDCFYCLNDDAPEWLSDAIQSAHDGMFPDDYIYQWCYDAACAYEDYDGNLDSAISDLESDVYNNALIQWLASHLSRIDLVDEALQECEFKEIIPAISYAQVREKERAYSEIFEAIRENAES